MADANSAGAGEFSHGGVLAARPREIVQGRYIQVRTLDHLPLTPGEVSERIKRRMHGSGRS